MPLVRVVALLALFSGCAADLSALDSDNRCGWFKQPEVVTLGQDAPCWRLETDGQCRTADPGITDSCDLPERPKVIWRSGEQAALWCPLWDGEHRESRMVKADCW